MLEKIKTLYNPTPGMAPEKIGPTVGQNSRSTSRLLCPAPWPSMADRISREDQPTLYDITFLRSRRSEGYPIYMAEIL
jgi:hypothetical protein